MGKKSLGRGLNAILKDHKVEVLKKSQEETIVLKDVPLSEIDPNPFQPRETFSEQEVLELAETIKEHGLIQPIYLRKSMGRYQIISGERRFRACLYLKKSSIQAKIAEKVSDKQMMELALIENIQRVELSAIEEAKSYDQLVQKFGYTHETLAKRVGKSRSNVSNVMRLVKLPETVQQWIHEGKLSASAGRALLSPDIKDPEKRAKQIMEKGLNVREVEKLSKKPKIQKPADPNIKQVEQDLQYILQRKIQLVGSTKKGVIKIAFNGNDDLQSLIQKFKAIEIQ